MPQTSLRVLSFTLPGLINERPAAWFSVYLLVFLQCETAERLLVMMHTFFLLKRNAQNLLDTFPRNLGSCQLVPRVGNKSL